MEYLPRSVDHELDELLPLAPAIAIDGPKGVGKTATALRRAGRVWSLDDPSQRSLLDADPRLITEAADTVLLDEWQRQPSVWDVVRRDVDAGAPPGRYLLTGSATPVAGADTHSGAGRVLSLRMRPMALHERGLETPTVSLAALIAGSAPIGGTTGLRVLDYLGCVEESGFPAIRTAVPRLRRALIDAYLQRVVDRDLPDHGLTVRRPETLRRWLQAYAAASSTTTAYSRLLDLTTAGDGTQPAKTTTIAYRDHLTSLWLLDPVAGWSPRRGAMFARLQQAPKHQLADPALAARLLGLSVDTLAGPRGASMAGPLFESLATLSVRVAAQVSEARVGHLRTGNGDHEVDLVVEGPDGQVVAFEVKLSTTVDDHDVRHLRWLRDQHAEVVDCVVLTTGTTAYRRRDGIAVVPLALLGD